MSESINNILILPSQKNYDKRVQGLLKKADPGGRFAGYDSDDNRKVLKILQDVTEQRNFQNTDDAVAHYTNKFDRVSLKPEEFKVSEEDLEQAHKEIDKKLLKSIRKAIKNVCKYQTDIFIGNKKENEHPGIKYTPIKRVGICVPGASAQLPSTVIMTAVPAIVAGVDPKDIVVVSPPKYKKNKQDEGTVYPVILAVCQELKIKNVYRVGGAQAVAALAYEKGKIPKVDKIVGPGNKWVQSAKKMVSGDYVSIDSIAGPSEVLIIADANANPAWVAADMLSQAEHADDSRAIVVTDSEKLAKEIFEVVKCQLKELSRAKNAEKSLLAFGAIVVLNNMSKVINFANEFAAEHLQIQCGDKSRGIADKIENAGAIFIGEYSPVAVGDYWAGPSHTLPTGMTAKYFSALSSNDFIKSTSIIEYDKEMLAASADDIIRLAQAEGLDAHAKSVQIRRQI